VTLKRESVDLGKNNRTPFRRCACFGRPQKLFLEKSGGFRHVARLVDLWM